MSSHDTGTLGKAVAILDLIARSPAPMRFSDIMVETGEPRGTLHRRLRQMLEERLVEIGKDGRYRLGLRLMHFASRAWATNDIRVVARPHLEALQKKVGETVHLGLLSGSEIAYLDKVEAIQSVRMYSAVGALSPVYCTGIGKAALSLLRDRELKEIVAHVHFKRYTARTLSGPEDLLADVERARQTGFAYDLEEHEEGICCIAVGMAVESRIGGVSITAPAYRADLARLDSWRVDLAETASRVAFDLQARLGPALAAMR